MQMRGSGWSVGGEGSEPYPPPLQSSKATVRRSQFFKMGEDHTYWRWFATIEPPPPKLNISGDRYTMSVFGSLDWILFV